VGRKRERIKERVDRKREAVGRVGREDKGEGR
jgi:hypothetical protein